MLDPSNSSSKLPLLPSTTFLNSSNQDASKNWLEEKVFKIERSKPSDYLMNFLSWSISIIGKWVAAPVGYAFGVNTFGSVGAGIFFGFCCYFALASMGGNAISDEVKALTISSRKKECNTTPIHIAKSTVKLLLLFLIALAALQIWYVSIDNVDGSFGIISGLFAFYTAYLYLRNSCNKLTDEMYESYKEYRYPDYQKIKFDCAAELSAVKKVVFSEEFKTEEITTAIDASEDTIDKLKILLSIQSEGTFLTPVPSSLIPMRLTSSIGLIIGAASGYGFYTISHEMMNWFFDSQDFLQDNDKETLTHFVSFIAGFFYGILNAVGCKTCFTRLYQSIFRKEFRAIKFTTYVGARKFFITTGVLFGLFSALPAAYIAKKGMNDQGINEVITFLMFLINLIGTAAPRMIASEESQNKFLNMIRELFIAKTDADKKDRLIQMITQLESKLLVISLAKNSLLTGTRNIQRKELEGSDKEKDRKNENRTDKTV